MQRILVCLVFAFAVFMRIAMNMALFLGIKDFGGIISEGFRMNADFKGKNIQIGKYSFKATHEASTLLPS